MHFLVTGGAGFIGSHVVEGLLLEGHQVTAVDNLTTGNLSNLPNHPCFKLIAKDIFACQPEDFADRYDGIAHLAATPSVTKSWLHPLASHQNNVSATVAVIQLCQALKIPRLVFTSSAAVYGNPINIPISEQHPTVPISPYGLQKLTCEKYINLFAQQFQFSAVNLRLFNVFGPRQEPTSPYSGVISIFVTAMQQMLPITIYGDGTQTRDFVYVKDVSNAFLKALTTSLAPGCSVTCNIGAGQAVSLIQLVEILGARFPKWPVEVNFLPSRLGDIYRSEADISNALHQLEFEPEWTTESGLMHFISQCYGSRIK